MAHCSPACVSFRVSYTVEGPSKVEWILLLVFCLMLAISGIAFLIFQWQRLERNLSKRRDSDELLITEPNQMHQIRSQSTSATTSSSKLKEYEELLHARRQRKASKNETYEDLASQVKELKHMQTEVRSTLAGLEQLVSHVQAKKKKEASTASSESKGDASTTISDSTIKKTV